MAKLEFKDIAYVDCLRGTEPYDLFVVAYDGWLASDEQRQVAESCLPPGEVPERDFGFVEERSVGLLVLVRALPDLLAGAERVWSSASSFISSQISLISLFYFQISILQCYHRGLV